METYSALDFPNDNSDSHFRRRENAHTAIHSVAERLGLKVSIDHPHGHDDIIWFSYAKGGIVQVKQIPIASKLERFATELGITEKAEWHDAWLEAQPFALNALDALVLDTGIATSLSHGMATVAALTTLHGKRAPRPDPPRNPPPIQSSPSSRTMGAGAASWAWLRLSHCKQFGLWLAIQD
ncbi:hypothetical protein B0H17DRAFT_1340239 [Mycena rosella]|uniref:Uncharacterized protein n=1 Tax=Mycena rosella TaxID=1033263 RepID=A0AAD7BPF1_MYCRO|nr:hypothetical protein B0H17DRAFT_1340239 [Mycena rosella]